MASTQATTQKPKFETCAKKSRKLAVLAVNWFAVSRKSQKCFDLMSNTPLPKLVELMAIIHFAT